MDLYNVISTAKEYHGCKNVKFHWFRHGDQKPRPYAELIENYDAGADMAYYAEDAINQLFTAIEAKALKAYLDREHGDDNSSTIIEKAKLPLPNNIMGVGAIPVGGGDDFYTLDEEPNYTLPFKAWGYFDLVGCELVDGSDVFHHRLLIRLPNGRLRTQSNEEAALNRRAADRLEYEDVPF